MNRRRAGKDPLSRRWVFRLGHIKVWCFFLVSVVEHRWSHSCVCVFDRIDCFLELVLLLFRRDIYMDVYIYVCKKNLKN